MLMTSSRRLGKHNVVWALTGPSSELRVSGQTKDRSEIGSLDSSGCWTEPGRVPIVSFFKRLASSLTGGKVTRPADAVDGQAQITAATGPHEHSVMSQGRFHAIISAPGVAAFPVEFNKIVRSSKWPFAGTVLACWVSQSNPQNYFIDFDSVPSHRDQARQQTAAQAAMMRGEMPGAAGSAAGIGGMFGGGSQIQFVGGSPSDLPPEKLARLEQMLGTDIDGDGIVGAPAAPAPPHDQAAQHASPGVSAAAADADERVRLLTQLHELHKAGALTDQEFANEKQRLLAE